MNWTKTTTGYACGAYTLTRTPGKRWAIDRDGEVLAGGKHFAKLGYAKQYAEDYEDQRQYDIAKSTPREDVQAIIATATDIAATLTPEEAQAGFAEVMGVEDSRCPTAEPTGTTDVIATTDCSDSPKTVPATEGVEQCPTKPTWVSSASVEVLPGGLVRYEGKTYDDGCMSNAAGQRLLGQQVPATPDGGGKQCSDPTPPATTESAPTTATATAPDASTAKSSSPGSSGAAPASLFTEAKFCRPVPRESLTDQFTRLQFYHDLGIVRRALRETA